MQRHSQRVLRPYISHGCEKTGVAKPSKSSLMHIHIIFFKISPTQKSSSNNLSYKTQTSKYLKTKRSRRQKKIKKRNPYKVVQISHVSCTKIHVCFGCVLQVR